MAKNFIVNRDDVWIGLLYGTEEKRDNYNKYHMGDILYRYIVFTKDNNGLAHDLLYTQDKPYPLVNEDYNIDVNRNVVVSDSINIGPLLKELNYPQLFDHKALTKAIREILSYRYLDNHLELFGLAKYADNYVSVYHAVDTVDPNIFFTIRYTIGSIIKDKPHRLELNVTKKS